MVFVYVIEIATDKTWYTGTAPDPIKRLKENNAGKYSHSLAIAKGKAGFLFTQRLYL